MKMNERKIEKRPNAFILTVLFAIFMIASAGLPVFAEDGVNSEGNILLDNGGMAFYSADIYYLETEKDNLFSELPVLPDLESFDFDGARQENIISKGRIDYADGKVMLDASDFIYLANEIDALEAAYKMNTVAALNHMGTYYLEDGSVTHDKSEESLPAEYAVNLSFAEIYEGVLQSQSVEHLATSEPLMGASADNLTTGTAAWLDGELVVGNGADNNASYNNGYNAGKSDGYNAGKSDGYNAGKSDGYNAGYNAGKSDGYNAGKSDGYNDGRTQGQNDVIANPSGYGISTGIAPEQFILNTSRADFSTGSSNLVVPHNGTCYLKFAGYVSYEGPHNANGLSITIQRNGTNIAAASGNDDGIDVSDGGSYKWTKTLTIPNCTKGETLVLKFNHNNGNASWVAGIY